MIFLAPIPCLIRQTVSVLAIGAPTSAAQTSLAKQISTTGWAVQSDVWYASPSLPSGTRAVLPADVAAAWAAHPALSFDPSRQTGYVRETNYGLPVFGDLSKGFGVRWRTVRVVCPCPTLADAQNAVAGMYTLTRAISAQERINIEAAGGWIWRGDPNDWRMNLKQLPWEALNSLAQVLPPTISSTMPAVPTVPYDAAEVQPDAVAPSVPYQSPPP